VSANVNGPYTRKGIVIPTQAHNAYYAHSPIDGMHLIYHIFTGANPRSCNPWLNCTDGNTPGAQVTARLYFIEC
jgi:hypothetical protein